MLVLLEEHPLEHLRTLVGVSGHVPGAVSEVPENRVRLGEGTTVVEHERRYPQGRVQVSQQLGPVRPIDDIDLASLVGQTEVG